MVADLAYNMKPTGTDSFGYHPRNFETSIFGKEKNYARQQYLYLRPRIRVHQPSLGSHPDPFQIKGSHQ